MHAYDNAPEFATATCRGDCIIDSKEEKRTRQRNQILPGSILMTLHKYRISHLLLL